MCPFALLLKFKCETIINNQQSYSHHIRDNLASVLGYEVDRGYPLAPYIPNARVWYLDELQEITFVRILEMFLLWMVLYNYIIPLSMYVSLELQKFLASQQFQWDRELYDPER